MLRKGRRGYSSGSFRLRTCPVIVFLEFLLLASVGWASRTSTTAPGDHMALFGDSSNEIATIRLHSTSDRQLALKEVQSLPKDVDLLRTSFIRRSVRGPQDLVRKVFGSGFNKHKIRVRMGLLEISRLVTPRRSLEPSPVYQQKLRGSVDDRVYGVIGSRSRGIISRRLLLTGSSGCKDRRSSSAAPQAWSFVRQQEQKGRRVIMEAGEQTQQMLLGPPSPPDLHNEKQDWNQDYAEPDVHPPSSN